MSQYWAVQLNGLTNVNEQQVLQSTKGLQQLGKAKMGLQILFELFELETTTNQWKVTMLMPNRSLSWSGGFGKRPKHRIGIQTFGSMCQVEVRVHMHNKS